MRATDAKLKPLVEASGGAHACGWPTQPDPDIRSVRPGRAAGGSDWIGLRRNEGYTVAGINQLPLLPGILVALAFLLAHRQRLVARGPLGPSSSNSESACPSPSRFPRRGGVRVFADGGVKGSSKETHALSTASQTSPLLVRQD